MRRTSASVLETWLERLRALYGALVQVRLPRIFGLVLRNPRDSACAAALMLAVTAIAFATRQHMPPWFWAVGNAMPQLHRTPAL